MPHKSLKELTEIFRQAGAKDPASWASSEIEEGINQLARFSFLKAVSSEILKEDDVAWVDDQIKSDNLEPDEPGAQKIEAIKEMLQKGVSKEAIIDLVRVVQFETLWHACCIIDGVYQIDTPVNQWGVFEMNEDYEPGKQIGGLHESLYEFDPSGKEMRPRSKG